MTTVEERFIHPLLRQVAPAVAEMLEEQHRSLDPAFEALARQHLASTAGYRALGRLMAAHFDHVAIEEAQALPALQEHFTDAMLVDGVLRPFRAAMPREQMLDDVAMQIPALSPAERFALLSGLAAS